MSNNVSIDGNIPVLSVVGDSLAEAYEKSLLSLYENGVNIKTSYDKEGDPLSIDATMNMTVLNPLSDPMIHKSFPGGISDLREYVYELEGLKDCLCRNENDLNDTRWEYLYSSRMTNYGTWIRQLSSDEVALDSDIVAVYENNLTSIRDGHFNINQVESVINKLVNQPYTRQAQMITWMPNLDNDVYDPPCYQSAWFRIIKDVNNEYCLNSNIRFRSNDAYKANFMNFFGFIQFINKKIRIPVEKRLGVEVRFGRINWQADSFHIYGKDINDFELRFLNRVKNTEFSDRVLEFYSDDVQEMYHESEQHILKKFEDIKKSFGIIK